MKIPYVIDNQEHLLSDVLNHLLAGHQGRSLDVASAYFNVGGFSLLKEGLLELGSLRLLLGAEPTTGTEIGLEPGSGAIKGLIQKDLEDSPFDEKTLRNVEDLIAYLRSEKSAVRLFEKGFLHAKAYLFYSDLPGKKKQFDRFRPLAGIVGSSNFTTAGLTSNRELNLSHKVILEPTEADDPDAEQAVSWLSESERATVEEDAFVCDEGNRQLIKSEVGARAIIDLERWYQKQWGDSRDFKDELIQLLDESKFGTKDYTPYEIYMKALYAYFAEDLDHQPSTATRSAVDLAEFQEDAVKKARKILAKYDGVMISDSVGLGKTWIGKKLLEDYAYHLRQKAVVVCPASLRDMWNRELSEASIAGQIVSQEELGREEFDFSPYGDADVVLVDESHNFRNRNAQRYEKIEWLLSANGRRGRDGSRKKVILLTATPINNDIFDLYNQLCLVTGNNRSYFSACGIGDLYRYFLQARRDSRQGNTALALFNLLEEVVIRRTRPFIRKAYPDATIRGKKISFPARQLRTVHYDLEATYSGIYDDIVHGIENLKLVPYNLESYKKREADVDDFEKGREQALVGIFKSRYLKRFESSVDAFRISIRRAIQFFKTFESYLMDNRLLKSPEFQKAMQYLEKEDAEDDATPRSLADEMDETVEAKEVLERMEEVDKSQYDLRHVHDDLQADLEIFNDIWHQIKDITYEDDAKLEMLKKLLSTAPDKVVGKGPKGESIHGLRGKKVLLFSYYKDTARYLYRHLGRPDSPDAQEFLKSLDGVVIRRLDSDADPRTRTRTVKAFAPKANNQPDWVGTENEIDVLISTDVLSEGQNLQDCGHLINYDLHWNPTRMVQRAGRIDRLGTDFDTLHLFNMFPDEGLERLLGIVQSLTRKIADIDQAGFLDASVLGETVHPQNFNTLRRIEEEDDSVIEEEEKFSELASNEFLLQQLRNLLDAGGKEMLDSLPDGIHSGLIRSGAKGVFFYFRATPKKDQTYHFWRYVDLLGDRVVDNRYEIANLIACQKDTPRVVDSETFKSIFEYQEMAIEDILKSFQEQQALETAPTTIDSIQKTLVTTIQGYLNRPDVDRRKGLEIIKSLNKPVPNVQIKELRKIYKSFQANGEISELLASLEALREDSSPPNQHDGNGEGPVRLERSDLKLVCFDVISGG